MVRALDVSQLQELGYQAGLSAVGVTTADVLSPAAEVLPSRKESGLADRMEFTYRNPGRSTSPAQTLPSVKSVITGALNYYQGPRATSKSSHGAEIARYSWDDYYAELRAGLEPIAEALRSQGGRAQVLADSNALVDRNAAWRSGLGWYGKNANLIIPGHGSWVVLGAILTDIALPPTGQPQDDQCGSCTACIAECPTGAIVAPGVVDARRCIAWLVQADGEIPIEYRTAVGNRIYGCDECQEVCPPNRSAPVTVRSTVKEKDQTADLVWVLSSDDEELLVKYGRWYIAGRDCDVLRRTALVAIGNSADPTDVEVVDLLKTYLGHDNPTLRSHAVWAAKRLGLYFLLEIVDDEPHESVLRELRATVESRFHKRYSW